MKALVTGGAGFIGANLALCLQSMLKEVVVLDNFLTGSDKNLISFEGPLIRGDIKNIGQLLSGWRPDVIFHQAAITDTTVMDESVMFETNVSGFQQVLDYAAKCDAKVVYASSAGVYGNGPTPMCEQQVTRPLNAYGKSKLVMDEVAEKYAAQHNILVIGLRYFNVYGPMEQHKGKSASMIWQLALQMISGKRPRIFKWGQQKRDQIYVSDVVTANLRAMDSLRSGVYNIGTGQAVSFNEIIETLNSVLGYSYEAEYIDNPYDFYQNKTLANMSKSNSLLGFKAKFDLKSGIEDYFKKMNFSDYVT